MNKNVRIALWGSLAIVVWFGTGLLKSSDSTDTEAEAVDNLTKVQVVHSKQQPFGPTLSLRAKTKANRAVDVLAQVSGKISATLIEEGRPVAAGQGICEVDAEDRPLRLSQAQAALENAEIAYRGALKLKAGGYQSELAISQAKTTLATAKTHNWMLQICTLKPPSMALLKIAQSRLVILLRLEVIAPEWLNSIH